MFRVGMGYDVHPFGGDGPLVLGGVVIEGPGLAGHSDADAVCHAVADSVLGPCGFPDLGMLFPATDERWRGASSVEMLRDVVGRIAADGWWIGNVDVVIAAERPRLAPHIPAMIEKVTEVLRAAQEPLGPGIHVSIKPKRGEGIGTIGRGEGIACWAVTLLERA